MVLGRLVCYRDVNASNICQALLNYEVSGAVSIGNIWLGANVLTSMNTQPSCLLGIGMIMNQDWEADCKDYAAPGAAFPWSNVVCGTRVFMGFACSISRMSWHVPDELKKEVTIEMVRTIGLIEALVTGVQGGTLEEALAFGVRQSHVSESEFDKEMII
ncbi:hypothetical protein AO1008_03755 [Aspergillus oryzae 100-8]|uniref:Uncharacterized protein n=1 Tax=Aspergillus oryzae (strain 3.042) TaxID=1160506 RepID=I8TNT6_ASPO3|nr:hypothetical protein Ao3042_08293 [Aspergillus oryzae 3.042]KDE86095.1 hypothetical protein AO1008_03755 [Aspergillus oryzae 100-8]|eukprot:EIT75603.1 hypothetical protein Ao3042_08293 [Aspergillus oryzae 3.042]